MTYPGGKNGSGVWQRIINHMPPHDIYVEAFLGSGAILRRKRPALVNIGIDRSAKALALCERLIKQDGDGALAAAGYELIEADSFSLSLHTTNPRALIYFDPPYVHSTRSDDAVYEFELDDAAHALLVSILVNAKAMVMISGYRCELYDRAFADWTAIDYQAATRRGPRPETLWMNFPVPDRLHDYRYLGDDFRERERIKRKRDRWRKKWAAMPPLERQAILAVIDAAG